MRGESESEGEGESGSSEDRGCGGRDCVWLGGLILQSRTCKTWTAVGWGIVDGQLGKGNKRSQAEVQRVWSMLHSEWCRAGKLLGRVVLREEKGKPDQTRSCEERRGRGGREAGADLARRCPLTDFFLLLPPSHCSHCSHCSAALCLSHTISACPPPAAPRLSRSTL